MKEIPSAAAARESAAAGRTAPKASPRHVLDFEKPLSRLEQQIQELEALQAAKQVDYTKELRQLRNNYTSLLRKTYDSLSAWETVQVSRHPQRPQFKDYVELVCREFREIHGDRRYGDDGAIKCGLRASAGTRSCSSAITKARARRKSSPAFRPRSS